MKVNYFVIICTELHISSQGPCNATNLVKWQIGNRSYEVRRGENLLIHTFGYFCKDIDNDIKRDVHFLATAHISIQRVSNKSIIPNQRKHNKFSTNRIRLCVKNTGADTRNSSRSKGTGEEQSTKRKKQNFSY